MYAKISEAEMLYVVEGFGEATPPQVLYFLVVVGGKAGNNHQKTMILGGLQALQTSPLVTMIAIVSIRLAQEELVLLE
jgi:hypothetical protein